MGNTMEGQAHTPETTVCELTKKRIKDLEIVHQAGNDFYVLLMPRTGNPTLNGPMGINDAFIDTLKPTYTRDVAILKQEWQDKIDNKTVGHTLTFFFSPGEAYQTCSMDVAAVLAE